MPQPCHMQEQQTFVGTCGSAPDYSSTRKTNLCGYVQISTRLKQHLWNSRVSTVGWQEQSCHSILQEKENILRILVMVW